MADEGAAKRRFPRYHCALDLIVYLSTKAIQARISQISRGGCLIFPPLSAQPTPGLKLSFRLGGDLPYINCKGEIVYNVSDKGTGVAFSEISIYNQDLITDYFEKRLAAEPSAGT